MPTYRVFVYGTLKRGEPNAYVMSNPKTGIHKYVGGAVTKEAYPLFVAGKWNIPFMLGDEGKGFRIHGELYDIDENKLKALDMLEGHPTVYQRSLRPVIPDGKNPNDEGAIEEVWMYTLKRYDPRLDDTKTKMLDKYYNGVEGRFYMKHDVVKSNDDL